MFKTETLTRFAAIRTPKRGLWAQINALIAAHKSRVALAKLDDEGRSDVGLTPKDVADELARPLWDIPNAWRKG